MGKKWYNDGAKFEVLGTVGKCPDCGAEAKLQKRVGKNEFVVSCFNADCSLVCGNSYSELGAKCNWDRMLEQREMPRKYKALKKLVESFIAEEPDHPMSEKFKNVL